MKLVKNQQFRIVIFSFLIAGIIGYWFTMHTVRGSSFALYVIGGWHAPLGVKWKCAAKTDLTVDKKFTLPLLFDQKTKNELKGFWYYSYYRQCLYDSGYDFKGNAIPKSTITEGVYTNPYGGFSFSVPVNTSLMSDNVLDVDFHDQLLVSMLKTDKAELSVHMYLKDTDITTFINLSDTLKNISLQTAPINAREIFENANGLQLLRVTDTDGTEGIIFMTPDLHIVHIFGPLSLKNLIDAIALNLTVAESTN